MLQVPFIMIDVRVMCVMEICKVGILSFDGLSRFPYSEPRLNVLLKTDECFISSHYSHCHIGQAFRGHDGCACCEDCFVSYCAPKCHLCKIPITEAHGKYLKVGNKTVHTHCYVCYSCKGSLQGK